MEEKTLNETIANLSSLYEEFNKRWLNDTYSISIYQFSRQKEYCDFYEELKNANIESLALRVITDSINEKNIKSIKTSDCRKHPYLRNTPR